MATKPLIAVVGPTASGKTALALELAERYHGEIICADSRTVYAGMDIGTAKPNVEERARVPHHLLDVVRPDERFTAADFQRLAAQAIDDITARGRLPIMVGGTGLYADSVLYGYRFGTDRNVAERAELEALSIEQLQSLCIKRNIELPANASNKRHLVRAIELGGINQQRKSRLRDNTLVIGLQVDRDVLLKRITQRVEDMFRQNVVTEATKLAHIYGWQVEPMTANIYRIVRGVLQGDYDEVEAIRLSVQSDMRLARRQMTWFRRRAETQWVSSPEQAVGLVETFLHPVLQPDGQKSDTIRET